MRTKAEALIDKVEDSIIKIQTLLSISYREDTYSEIVKAIGGEIEKFLKSDVLNLSNKNFNALIDELKNFNVSDDKIDFLHDFRLCYNGYKHEPNYSKTIFQVKTILENLKCSLEEIKLNNIGSISQPYQNNSKRVVWFAGWDDYIGGMVECNIFIPNYKLDMPTGIEHFNIDWKAWDVIVDKFIASNELFLGKEHVSDKAYDFWQAQSDFLGAGVFIGDVSEFVRELSKHIAKNENDLFSFLTRKHDKYSVYCGIVFSIYDTLRENKWIDFQSFKDEVVLRISYDYGIDITSPYLEYLKYLNFENIDKYKNQLKDTNDILWLDEKTFQNEKKEIISEKLQIGFDKDFNIVTILNDELFQKLG